MTAPAPRPRSAAPVAMVRRELLAASGFGLLVESPTRDLDLAAWIHAHRAELLSDLDTHGAVMFRGFADDGPTGFRAAAEAIGLHLLDYLERAAPRTEVIPNVFTSTEFPADQPIPLHHEMSYSHQWPGRLYFYCETAAASGGGTPLSSEREVFPRIPAGLRERFTRQGVRYVRNYCEELDLPWQEVFQTTDRAEVEAYFAATDTRFTWTGSGGLRTEAIRQATATHPRTGETVWFNHAHLFHSSNLPADVASALIAEVGLDGLPRNAYYGDGEVIEDEVMALVRGLYDDCAHTFPWRRGDVLVVDNFLAVHGREPFTGPRRILVAMSDLCGNASTGTEPR